MIPRLTCRRAIYGTAVGLLTALVAGACDKMPLLAPTESTITLSGGQEVLPVNGSTEITATVIEQSGTPVHNGTAVTFTTTLGTIEPREARTSGGNVTVLLHAGSRSGTAMVSAFSGSARAEEDLEIEIGAAAVGTILLTVSPGTVPSTGGTVQLVATVHDESGNPMPGVPVTFTADQGTLGSSTVITDANGEARTTLTTNRETGVRANAGGQSDLVTVLISTPLNVNLSATPSPAAVDTAVVFTATVTGSTVPIASYVWDFGDGSKLTTSGNEVTHVYTSAATVVVKVTVTNTDGVSGSTQISLVVAPSQFSIALTFSPTSPTSSTSVTFTALVAPSTIAIDRFVWNFGDGTPTVTTSGNTTTHTFSSVAGPGSETFIVTVTAFKTIDDTSVSTEAAVTVLP